MLGALERKGLIVQKLFWLLQEDGGGEKGFDMIDIEERELGQGELDGGRERENTPRIRHG